MAKYLPRSPLPLSLPPPTPAPSSSSSKSLGQYESKKSLRLDNKQHIYITTTNHHTHSHPYVIHIWRPFIIMMPNYAMATKAAVTFLRWKIVWMVKFLSCVCVFFFRFADLGTCMHVFVGCMRIWMSMNKYIYINASTNAIFSVGPFTHTIIASTRGFWVRA